MASGIIKVNRALWVIVAVVVALGFVTFNMMQKNKAPKLLVKDAGDFMERTPVP